MDWDGGMPKVTTWDKIDGSDGASNDVPPLDKQTKPQPLSIFCSTGTDQYELVEYTSEVTALPHRTVLCILIHRRTSSPA